MTTLPTVKVEISFDDPLDTSPSWTDVTAYVRHVSGLRISRGRSSESSTFAPGVCTFTLSNRDRRFDPLYASGPYYGSLLPRRQVRVTATWSAVDYVLFRGFVTGWPQEYPEAGLDAVVEIEAVDGLAVLAETFLPADPITTTDFGDLLYFWRQNDGNRWIDEGPDSAHMTPAAGSVAVGSGIVPGSASPAVVFDGLSSSAWVRGLTGVPLGAFTISVWVKTTAVGSSSSVLRYIGGGLGVDNNGHVRWIGYDTIPMTGPSTAVSNMPINDGRPHHIVIRGELNNNAIFIDGMPGGSVTEGTPAPYVEAIGYATGHLPWDGEIQDFAVFDDPLSAAQVRDLYALGMGFLRESTTARATRVLDAVGWPSAWRDLTSSPRGECYAIPYGTSALAHLELVAATEQGRLFVSADGDLTLHTRYHHQEVPAGSTVQTTFSDDGSDVKYRALGFDYSDREVQNDITVAAAGVGQATSTDATSITAYGRQSASVQTLLPTLALAQSMADGLVFWRKDAAVRSRPVVVRPAPSGTQPWASTLDLEIGDRIKVEITPLAVGSQIAQELLIERIDWSITADLWECTITGSPVPAAFFVLGTSELGTGRLGF